MSSTRKRSVRAGSPDPKSLTASFSVEQISVEELAKMKAPYNPRRISDHQMRALRRGMERDGCLENIVCNRQTGHVVSGHQRIDAAAEIDGMTTLPVHWIDVSEEDEKRINIALNRISGEFDEEELADVLRSISEDARAMTGFTAVEVEALLEETEGATLNMDETNEDAAGFADDEQFSDQQPFVKIQITRGLLSDATFKQDLITLCDRHNLAYKFQNV